MAAGVGSDRRLAERQQRGLAGTGAADDDEKLARGDRKRYVINSPDAAAVKTLADVLECDQGRDLAHMSWLSHCGEPTKPTPPLPRALNLSPLFCGERSKLERSSNFG